MVMFGLVSSVVRRLVSRSGPGKRSDVGSKIKYFTKKIQASVPRSSDFRPSSRRNSRLGMRVVGRAGRAPAFVPFPKERSTGPPVLRRTFRSGRARRREKVGSVRIGLTGRVLNIGIGSGRKNIGRKSVELFAE